MDRWEFDALGTRWLIDSARPVTSSERDRVSREVERFDRAWSRFRDDSVVTAASRQAGTWQFPAEGAQLFDLFDALHAVTDGAVSPLIGDRLASLGYDAGYSLVPAQVLADVPRWRDVRREGSAITLQQPTMIDVGAAGKGLLVDLVLDVLRSAGHTHVTVNASGDMVHWAENSDGPGVGSLRVGLEHPGDPSRVIGVIELAPGQAVCASGVNRRAWGDGLHHVIDARTGQPTAGVIATWVVSEASCMLADGLATALFFTEPSQIRRTYDFDWVRVHADGRVDFSPTLQGDLFI
jgi:thiamine biosynthesis lipoprotein